MCAIPSGQAGPSPPWPNAIVRPGYGAIKWLISGRWPGRGRPHRRARFSPRNNPVCYLRRCIAFNTDRVETVGSHKTIYVRFDLNDYSIPPEASRPPADSGRLRHDGAHSRRRAEFARHPRSL